MNKKYVNDEFIKELLKLGYPNNTDGDIFNENYSWFNVNGNIIWLCENPQSDEISHIYKKQIDVIREFNDAIK